MTTIRRLYLYLASFAGMVTGLGALFVLIGLLVNEGFDAFRGFSVIASAPALALLIVGGLVWRFYWRILQREGSALLDERAAGTRKFYLYLTMALGLLIALELVRSELTSILLRFVEGWSGYKPWTPLLIAAALAGVWWYHRRIADTERALSADGERGADLRRGYWFVLTGYGVLLAATGLAAFLAGLLSHLGGEAPGTFGFGFVEQTWLMTLIPPTVQVLVGALVLRMFWVPSHAAAAGGDEAERTSRVRSALIHLVVLVATMWIAIGAQGILADVLARLLLGVSSRLLVLTLAAPLSQLLVGGLLLWIFFRTVRSTLVSPRLSEYIIAGVGFAVALLGALQLLDAVFRVLGGRGDRIEVLVVQLVPPLLVGGGLWFWRWRAITAEASGEASGQARAHVWRKVYLYIFQFIGLLLAAYGAATILNTVVASFLGKPSTDFLVNQSGALAALLVGLGLMIYLLQILNSDARLGALPPEDLMRMTVGDEVPTWALLLVLVVFVVMPVLLASLFGISRFMSGLGGF